MSVRVRFAPSPTGPLHMGGVRTALYNYLFAKKHGGTFLLRIEDTDQNRYVEGAENYILKALDWCGLTPEEGVGFGGKFGPYRQSERKHLYKEYADRLIESGWAYYAFDTPEEIEAARERAKQQGLSAWQYDQGTRLSMRNSLSLAKEDVEKLLASGSFVVRFKIPSNERVDFVDLIRGEVSYDSNVLDDKVLFKSDGMPTYHLANIVDDHLMEITHVIRGEEWLPSAPLHTLMYRAFGWKAPQFAHLPLILKPSGNGKLSKRDGDKDGFPVFPLQWQDPTSGEVASGYREHGYLNDAFVNMLLMLGWNPGTDQEVFSREEMIENFSLERVIKSGARFSPEKARWFNEQYLRARSGEELAALIDLPLNTDPSYLAKVCELMKERSTLLPDWLSGTYFFEAPSTYDEKMARTKWKPETSALMGKIATLFSSIEPFEALTIETTLSEFMTNEGVGFGQVGPGLRLLLTGTGGGPAIPAIAETIGKKETLARMENGIKHLDSWV